MADHYNSNPTSLKAALGLLKNFSASHDTERGSHVHKGPRIAVLGDMLELGENEELYHRNVAADLATASPTSVFLYGKRMLWLFDVLKTSGAKFSVQHFDNHDELCKALIPSVTADCTILIKGSRGMKLENVLKKLTVPPLNSWTAKIKCKPRLYRIHPIQFWKRPALCQRAKLSHSHRNSLRSGRKCISHRIGC